MVGDAETGVAPMMALSEGSKGRARNATNRTSLSAPGHILPAAPRPEDVRAARTHNEIDEELLAYRESKSGLGDGQMRAALRSAERTTPVHAARHQLKAAPNEQPA